MKLAFWGLAAIVVVTLVVVLWFRGASLIQDSSLSTTPAKSVRTIASSANRELVLRALRGSPDAATELISIHDECLSHGDADKGQRDHCWNEVNRWVEIGLQNGSPVAAQIKVNELLQSHNCADIYRAEYWMIRYKGAGAGNELMWKSDASTIAQKKQSCSW